MRCLLISAYHAQSHAFWCSGVISAFASWDWQLLTLPARYFNWRIRGNALSLVDRYQDLLAQPYDLILATSMTDVVGLKSFVPSLVNVPCALYFHENQFAYPGNAIQQERLEPQMMTLYSAVAADALVFNSEFNRASFLDGVQSLADRLPDGVPAELASRLRQKSRVLPVPLPPSAYVPIAQRGHCPTIIWNHRWEHDKAPERLFEALAHLRGRVTRLKVHVVGQQFRRVPPVFDGLKQLLIEEGWLGTWGYQVDLSTYHRLLDESHWVVSTAVHDFQGLSVLEAAARGCVPVLPARLAYPEWFEPDAAKFYPSYPQDSARETQALAELLGEQIADFERRDQLVESHQQAYRAALALSWDQLQPKYASLFRDLLT
ncbi:tRNA-queuosine alpha-mannosyltransferase domain-containing protein [Simiduia aestuariiviva]|uniref:tRNA-queuosine alpha-mannosyltransferase n=1 Tax=Simiduia aestuariiviva TaxID=1510459 RepID=A0A839ULE2_9GAMM|nr:glycosyltransferase involved in cell wall biosynthesis [Simiduia aestuariiviva]